MMEIVNIVFLLYKFSDAIKRRRKIRENSLKENEIDDRNSLDDLPHLRILLRVCEINC